MEALQYRNMPIGNFSDNGIGNKLFGAGTAFLVHANGQRLV